MPQPIPPNPPPPPFLPTGRPRGELNMESFIRILSAQLAHQNPMEPMKDRDFFAQMAQLGQVQGIEVIKNSLDVTKATSLMGKKVTALRPQEPGRPVGQTATGIVKKLSIREGVYYLTIEEANRGTVDVRIDMVREVSNP